MPRTKTTRNAFGSVIPRKIKRAGKTVTVYDARKRYTDADGKPAEKFKRCSSDDEAMRALINFASEITAEQHAADRNDHTLGELTAHFRTTYVKAATFAHGEKIVGYRKNLTHIKTILTDIETFFGPSSLLSRITVARIKEFKVHLQSTPTRRDTPPAASTVNEKLAFLNRLLTVAFELGWLDINPFKKTKGIIKKPRHSARNRPLTFAEEIALYDACQPHDQIIEVERKIKGKKRKYTQTFHVDRRELWNLIITSADTGLRAGEIFALSWHQIDLDRRVIYLTREAAEQTKTGEPGILPMTSRLHALFADLYNKVSIFSGNTQSNSPVFRPYEYRKAFENACREAGIQGLQFRDLRNTASTRMVEAGTPQAQVKKITRHTTDEVFQGHYVSVDIAAAQRVGSALDSYIAENTKNARRKGNAKGNGLRLIDPKAA